MGPLEKGGLIFALFAWAGHSPPALLGDFPQTRFPEIPISNGNPLCEIKITPKSEEACGPLLRICHVYGSSVPRSIYS